MEAQLAEILNQLKNINTSLQELHVVVSAVKRQQHTLELNLAAIQDAYGSVIQQVNNLNTRCANRAERIKSFLDEVECAGPPARKTPSRAVPTLTALASAGKLPGGNIE